MIACKNRNPLSTVKPRYNEVPRDWQNVFVIKGVRYIGVLLRTFYN